MITEVLLPQGYNTCFLENRLRIQGIWKADKKLLWCVYQVEVLLPREYDWFLCKYLNINWPSYPQPHLGSLVYHSVSLIKQQEAKGAPSPLWWNSWSVLQISRVCDGGTGVSSQSSVAHAGMRQTQCGLHRRSELHLSGIRGGQYFSCWL